MMTMALIPLIGCGIAVIGMLLIHHRVSVQREATKVNLDRDVQDSIKQAKALDVKLTEDVLGGADVDTAITDFTKGRASIHAQASDSPWMWDIDDLKKKAEAELAARTAALNTKGRLVALSLLVGIGLAVTTIDMVLYNQLSSAQPVLSPLLPPKASGYPVAAPAPGATPTAVDPNQSSAPQTP